MMALMMGMVMIVIMLGFMGNYTFMTKVLAASRDRFLLFFRAAKRRWTTKPT